MKKYAPNSPEALARILAMFMITDGNMDPREIETLENLHVYELLNLSRKDFIKVLVEYCNDISDEADEDGTIHLLASERTNIILDGVTERSKSPCEDREIMDKYIFVQFISTDVLIICVMNMLHDEVKQLHIHIHREICKC